MFHISPDNYNRFSVDDLTSHVIIKDHMGGFDLTGRSPVLDRLQQQVNGRNITVESEYIFESLVKNNYPNFNFKFSLELHNSLLGQLQKYNIHPELTFKTFLCSFNGSPHVSRKLLVAILKKFEFFNPDYSSKNFTFSEDVLTGHINNYVFNRENFYNKFFIVDDKSFYNTIYSFGHNRFDHAKNIYTLAPMITGSFLHIVSDTMATSYYPFFGEKFLYSVVNRGLFLSYAQPRWHEFLEKYYGFKLYTKLFNYRFDTIENPVERLVELMSMISKFSVLSTDDWRDLYEIEKDTIEYNYDHYFSGDYLKHLKKYTQKEY